MKVEIEKDLAKLGAERVVAALNSVIQLLDSDSAVLRVKVFIAGAIVANIAEDLKTMTGVPAPDDMLRANALMMVSEVLGVECDTASPEEVEAMRGRGK
jgi:hypothetical protein